MNHVNTPSPAASLINVSAGYFDNPLSDLKPKRQSFKKIVVTDGSGKMVSEEVWAEKVKGHQVNRVLKQEGFQKSSIFLKDEYERVKLAFYTVKRARVKILTNSMIDKAFQLSNIPKTKKIEHILLSILPMMKKNTPEEITSRFGEIIRTFEYNTATASAVSHSPNVSHIRSANDRQQSTVAQQVASN